MWRDNWEQGLTTDGGVLMVGGACLAALPKTERGALLGTENWPRERQRPDHVMFQMQRALSFLRGNKMPLKY